MKFRLNFFGDPLKGARKALGDEGVIIGKEMRILGGKKIPKPSLLYDQAIFDWAAEENQKGEKWRLFLRTQQSIAEVRKNLPKEFCPASVFDQENLPSWVTHIPEPAYRLINFKLKPVFLPNEEPFITMTDRAWMATAVQALIAFKLVRQQVFLENEFHVADEENCKAPLIGNYDRSGLLAYTLAVSEVKQLSCVEDKIGTLVCRVPLARDKKQKPPA